MLQQRAHVRVDIIATALPEGVAARLEQGLNAVGAIISGALCYYGVRATITDFIEDSKPDKLLVIADWWMMGIFSVACLMLVIGFLLRLRHRGDATAGDDPAVVKARY